MVLRRLRWIVSGFVGVVMCRVGCSVVRRVGYLDTLIQKLLRFNSSHSFPLTIDSEDIKLHRFFDYLDFAAILELRVVETIWGPGL
jgi:hypothetical protein